MDDGFLIVILLYLVLVLLCKICIYCFCIVCCVFKIKCDGDRLKCLCCKIKNVDCEYDGGVVLRWIKMLGSVVRMMFGGEDEVID